MGFLDMLGSALGTMAARGQQINEYKDAYQYMDKEQLWQEYRELKNDSNEVNKYKCTAIRILLKERLVAECERMGNERLERIYVDLEGASGEMNRIKYEAVESVLRKRGYDLE